MYCTLVSGCSLSCLQAEYASVLTRRLAPARHLAPAGRSLAVSALQTLPISSGPPLSRSPLSSATLSARLSCVLSGFFACRGEGADACSGAPLAGAQKPPGSAQTSEHRGGGLPESSLPVLRHQRRADPRCPERWLLWERRADPALALSGLSGDF